MKLILYASNVFHCNKYDFSFKLRASVKLFELEVRTPGGLFFGRMVRWGIDFRRFPPSQAFRFLA